MHAAVADLTHDVNRLTERALAGARCDEAALAGLMTAVEARVQAALPARRPQGEPAPACTTGCASCCTVHVGTLAPEGAAVAAFLRKGTAPGALPDQAARLLRFHTEVRWVEDGERIRAGLRCPFLGELGACSIHPVRPLACRALSSLDAADCRQALLERAEGDGPGLVRMNLLQKALYDEAHAALGEALARRGLDARCRDVTGMAGWFLADAGRAAAFVAGVPVGIE